MRSPIAEPRTLEDARREIDRVDSGILELIARRLALVDRVRALKSDTGTSSPLRPAREAIVIRRIMEEAGADVRQRDADRRQYLERYYDKDTNDPYLYDLQINTATITLEVAAQMVVRLIRPDGVAA